MTMRRSPKKPDKRQAWFQYQLRVNGSSYSAVAKAVEVSRQAVRQSILNPSPRVADEVANVLGKEKSELWPARFKAPNL
jgi:lambda repressor-like predicted transcriptional regulator